MVLEDTVPTNVYMGSYIRHSQSLRGLLLSQTAEHSFTELPDISNK